ncbi:putative basic proline-rich protein-like [Triplophysa rosa]|uniref:Basic proline-rich protein-like n=1 Tax=Triplophysa rosa TaxID=992332 RepID=A0A9W7X5E5_TRIRA|nr:putative basic proline-rich protein-like [Triplophysa rosa]
MAHLNRWRKDATADISSVVKSLLSSPEQEHNTFIWRRLDELFDVVSLKHFGLERLFNMTVMIVFSLKCPSKPKYPVWNTARVFVYEEAYGPSQSCSSATYSEVRDEDEMSITGSEGDLLASDPDDSSELPPPGGRAQEEADVEMSTMLFRAAASIGLQCTAPPLPQRSRLDTWYLGFERGSKPRPAPVPFFPEVHEELSKTWNAPLTARSNQNGSVDQELPSMVGRPGAMSRSPRDSHRLLTRARGVDIRRAATSTAQQLDSDMPIAEQHNSPCQEQCSGSILEPESLTVELPESLTVEQPENLTMEQPENLTVEMPENLTVEMPENLTVEMPESLTVEMPESLTVEKPENLTVEMPENLTVEMPESLTVEMPESLTVEQPENLTVEMPENLTVEMPESLTVEMPESLTVEMPESLTVEQPENLTVEMPENLTVELPESLTVEMPESLTLEMPESLTVEQPENLTVEMPENLTVEMPESLTVEQPENLTVEMPENLTVKQESLTEEQPKNLTKESETVFILNLVSLSSPHSPTSLCPPSSTTFTAVLPSQSSPPPLPCSKSLRQRKKRTKTSICSPAPSATSVSPPSLIPTDLSVPQSCPPPAASSISKPLSQEGPKVKKKRKSCLKCSRQKIFLFDKITGERLKEGKAELKIHWLPCTVCGKTWDDTWEPASGFQHFLPVSPNPNLLSP